MVKKSAEDGTKKSPFSHNFLYRKFKNRVTKIFIKDVRMDATIVINFLFRTIEAKLEDIGNHSIRPKMCLNSCLISFLGKLLRAFYKSYNALSFKVILQEAIQSRHAMNWMPPKYMYIVQQKYQFKRISNQTPGILATIIS